MRQKRRHTWTVSFVEVPLGPLRAGGAPESTKQPRYPGTGGGSGVRLCRVPPEEKSTQAAQKIPILVQPGPLTVARGDIAVTPIDPLLCLGYVTPGLHVSVGVPARGGQVVPIQHPQRLQVPGPTPRPIRKMAAVCVRICSSPLPHKFWFVPRALGLPKGSVGSP